MCRRPAAESGAEAIHTYQTALQGGSPEATVRYKTLGCDTKKGVGRRWSAPPCVSHQHRAAATTVRHNYDRVEGACQGLRWPHLLAALVRVQLHVVAHGAGGVDADHALQRDGLLGHDVLRGTLRARGRPGYSGTWGARGRPSYSGTWEIKHRHVGGTWEIT